jgi:hypothetical protein
MSLREAPCSKSNPLNGDEVLQKEVYELETLQIEMDNIGIIIAFSRPLLKQRYVDNVQLYNSQI